MEVDSVVIIAVLTMSYITTRIEKIYTSVAKISSVRRTPNYHTTCGKNCHKILSAYPRKCNGNFVIVFTEMLNDVPQLPIPDQKETPNTSPKLSKRNTIVTELCVSRSSVPVIKYSHSAKWSMGLSISESQSQRHPHAIDLCSMYLPTNLLQISGTS